MSRGTGDGKEDDKSSKEDPIFQSKPNNFYSSLIFSINLFSIGTGDGKEDDESSEEEEEEEDPMGNIGCQVFKKGYKSNHRISSYGCLCNDSFFNS